MATTSNHRPRRITAKVLLVLGCLLMLLANVTVWLRLTALDTDRFVSTLEPLANDEQLDAGLAQSLTDRIATRVDIQQRVEDALPNDNPLVVATVTRLARSLVQDALTKVLGSDAFGKVWTVALRRTHERALDVIEGADGSVALQLSDVLRKADARLEKRGLDLFNKQTVDDVDSIVVASSDQLRGVRQGVDLLRKLSIALPIAAVVVLAGAVLLSTDRRRTLALAGVGVAVAMVVTGIALRIARRFVFDQIDRDVQRRAGEAVWSSLASPLFRQTAVLLALGLLVAGAAWLAGPGISAVRLRGWLRERRPAAGLHKRLRPAQVAVCVVGAAVLLLIPALSLMTALVVIALVAVAVVGLQLVAGPSPASPAA